MRELHFSQVLPISLEEAWNFFSNPENLKEITPKYMDFVVESKYHGSTIYAGQVIRYTVKPVLGIPMKWCTEITHVEDKSYFVDEQRFGPYSFWHHEHRFTTIADGVRMDDILNYKVPMGILGNIVDQLYIQHQVNSIFQYRKKVLLARFGNVPSTLKGEL